MPNSDHEARTRPQLLLRSTQFCKHDGIKSEQRFGQPAPPNHNRAKTENSTEQKARKVQNASACDWQLTVRLSGLVERITNLSTEQNTNMVPYKLGKSWRQSVARPKPQKLDTTVENGLL